MPDTNWWLIGYRAAMHAKKAADFDLWLSHAPENITEYARKQWFAGWHSVWKCERLGETS